MQDGEEVHGPLDQRGRGVMRMWSYVMRYNEEDKPEWAAVETDESVEPFSRI